MDIRRPQNRAEHRAALSRLIDRHGAVDPTVEQRVAFLEEYAARRGLSLDHCLIAVEGAHIQAVCLFLDSPGRTSSVLISPSASMPHVRQGTLSLLAEAERQAGRRGVQLLQGMVAPECSGESLVFAAAGYRLLATLLYMQNDLPRLKTTAAPKGLTWETYSPQTHALFAGVVQTTYQDSLDCGSLNGVRHIEDILASHRATGRHDPDCWRVGLAEGEPVGVILLAHMEEQETFEVVYMGCLPGFRGRGYGAALLAHAVELARGRRLDAMSLSVDEKNLPARKLYEAFGFIETARRDVWIKILGQ